MNTMILLTFVLRGGHLDSSCEIVAPATEILDVLRDNLHPNYGQRQLEVESMRFAPTSRQAYVDCWQP